MSSASNVGSAFPLPAPAPPGGPGARSMGETRPRKLTYTRLHTLLRFYARSLTHSLSLSLSISHTLTLTLSRWKTSQQTEEIPWGAAEPPSSNSSLDFAFLSSLQYRAMLVGHQKPTDAFPVYKYAQRMRVLARTNTLDKIGSFK
jgi:hypothetical protein